MNKKKRTILTAVLILVISFIAYKFIDSGVFVVDREGINKIYDDVAFDSIVDGDTAYFIINGQKTKCRFLAVDTPELDEKEAYAEEAKDFSEDVLKKAKTIRLLTDAKSDEYDKYGRLLVWVYADNKLLQSELVDNGLAEVKYVYDDYKYADELYKIEEKAKANKVGIWSLNQE